MMIVILMRKLVIILYLVIYSFNYFKSHLKISEFTHKFASPIESSFLNGTGSSGNMPGRYHQKNNLIWLKKFLAM